MTRVIYKLWLRDDQGNTGHAFVVAPPKTPHAVIVAAYRKAHPSDARRLFSIDEYGTGPVAVV